MTLLETNTPLNTDTQPHSPEQVEAPTTVRKRTRATAEQLSVLEDTFAANVSPNSKHRKELSERLQMSERSIQIWFQNRRAKVKHMQKRAQMQMQQASIRAQMYHYHHQQHYQPYGGPPILPQQQVYPVPRSSEDSTCLYPSSPTSLIPSTYPMDYLQTGLLSPSPSPDYVSSMPLLVPVPDAGPTAMLATPSLSSSSTSSTSSVSSTCSNAVMDQGTVSPQDICNPPMTTIDPSSLMINHSSPSDLYLNGTTLTIGTWHRLKLHASDLLCLFTTNRFEWHIKDAGCHFKMEIPLSSVANIDFVQDNNGLADIHFDISSSPLFYMETTTTGITNWVQCSDFTEGKQASRFFRHSLKGISQQMKQDLIMLMDQCPDTRRWIRFIEQQPMADYLPPFVSFIIFPSCIVS
ncbi:hypothetical protein BC941DRAFT_463970 [Chlamydoabsidia padenii]|nr:hypothetical protein BC941DRAFT_463970 [Chlamydoabsidia padenii]